MKTDELEVRVNLALMKLERTCYQLKLMQEDLSQFLDEYYARVGAHLAENTVEAAPVELVSETEEEQQDAVEAAAELKDECKRLYHALARHYHPDAGPEGKSKYRHTIMSAVNQAYRRHELGTLIRLSTDTFREEISTNDDEMRMALETRYFEVRRLTDLAEDSIASLRETPEYQLKLSIHSAREQGVDAMQAIIEQMNRLAYNRQKQSA